MDDKLPFGIPGCCANYDDKRDEIDESHTNSTGSWRQWAATDLGWFDFATCYVDGSECNDGDDADADEEEQASPADDGLTQTLVD